MRKMLLGSLLVFGVLAMAGLENLVEPGSTDSTFPAGETRDTVLVNTRVGVDPPAFAVVSTAFTDLVLGGFETAGADDFTVPDCGWEVNRIRAYGNYSDPAMTGSTGPATSVNVYILEKAGLTPASTDLAGTALYFAENLSYTELDLVDGGDFEIDVPGWVLPSGDYWIVVQANMELLAVGQWNWTESSLTPNSGTTNGDESAWFQSAAGVASPVTGMAECVGGWGQRLTSCQMTRNPDTNPPLDGDFAFMIEGNVLVAGVEVSPVVLSTTEDGGAVNYAVVLSAPPTPGATVTITPASSDATEGTVSAAINFTGANWDVAQNISVTPGASGDGNDGDVAYTITNAVSSTAVAGCYDGVTAADVSVTNSNIEGIATIVVSPSSSITVSEDGTVTQVVTFTHGPDITPVADVSIDLTVNDPAEVSVSTGTVVLTAGNGYSATATITGVADDVKELTTAFSITTEPAVSADLAFAGVDPLDISGSVTDSNTVAVTVTPNQSPLQTSEAGATDTISYVLTAEPTADVTISLGPDDPDEASVAPATLTFTSANWDTAQVVTVTGQNDDIDDGTTAYEIIATPTSSADPFWEGVLVAAVDGENADDADTAGATVTPSTGIVTSETGTTDTFTVALNSEPTFSTTVDVRSGDTTEGLVSTDGVTFTETVTLTFTAATWNVPQTITVQGQDDDVRDDGDIAYTIFTENVVSGDPNYNGQDGFFADVSATNLDEGDIVGITVAPASLTMDEDSPAMTFTVVLDSEPSTSTVSIPVTSGDTSEATVSPASLTFSSANWNVAQTVTVTPVEDFIVDADQTFDVTVGPASGGNYTGLSDTVSVTVNNIDTCAPMTL